MTESWLKTVFLLNFMVIMWLNGNINGLFMSLPLPTFSNVSNWGKRVQTLAENYTFYIMDCPFNRVIILSQGSHEFIVVVLSVVTLHSLQWKQACEVGPRLRSKHTLLSAELHKQVANLQRLVSFREKQWCLKGWMENRQESGYSCAEVYLPSVRGRET